MVKRCIWIVMFLGVFSTSVDAGSEANTEPSFAPEEIIKFAKEVEKYAANEGARAFIIGRVGRKEDDLPKGIHFTHTAIAIYSTIELNDGQTVRGYAIHNLYQQPGQPDKSALVTDYPMDFFWGVKSLKAGIVIPTPEIQQRLIEIVSSGTNAALHNSNYSVIANPFNNQFQNCTEHTLDMINAAIYQTTDVARLKANAKAHFEPQRLRTSRFKLMFGSMLMDDVTTRDHNGKVYTTTFSSIARYLDKYQLVEQAVTFDANGNTATI